MKRVSVASSRRDRAFWAACLLAMALPLAALVAFVARALVDVSSAHGALDPKLAFAGLVPAIFSTAMLGVVTVALAAPVGIGAAIWLEEIAPPGRLAASVDWSASRLASVPPFLIGLAGFWWCLFARASMLFVWPTLALVILPMVIASSRRALRAVPETLRDASFALGADRMTAVRQVVLPIAMPRIVTGVVHALARAVGESAPLVVLGLLEETPLPLRDPPLALHAVGRVLRAREGWATEAAPAIVALLVVVLALHGAASWMSRGKEGRRA